MKIKLDRYEQENFDLHDGRVVRVAHRIDRVYLDLGKADGLRPNLSFAVYPQTSTDFQRDEFKAMIEVTRITGDHQSEARITPGRSHQSYPAKGFCFDGHLGSRLFRSNRLDWPVRFGRGRELGSTETGSNDRK